MTTILEQFDEAIAQFNLRRGVTIVESEAQGHGQTPPLERTDEAARRADRLARIPVATYSGLSIFINPTMKDNTWRLISRGLGRAEMNKITFLSLKLEVERRVLLWVDAAQMLS